MERVGAPARHPFGRIRTFAIVMVASTLSSLVLDPLLIGPQRAAQRRSAQVRADAARVQLRLDSLNGRLRSLLRLPTTAEATERASLVAEQVRLATERGAAANDLVAAAGRGRRLVGVKVAIVIVPPTVAGAWLLAAARRSERDRRRRSAGRCVRCGYDVRASPGRCPECGTTLVSPAP